MQSTSDCDCLYYRRCIWWIFTSLLANGLIVPWKSHDCPHPIDHLDPYTDKFHAKIQYISLTFILSTVRLDVNIDSFLINFVCPIIVLFTVLCPTIALLFYYPLVQVFSAIYYSTTWKKYKSISYSQTVENGWSSKMKL